MNKEGLITITAMAVILTAGGAALVAAEQAGGGVAIAKDWKFSLPAGNAVDGQHVFMKMECYSCHRVQIAGVQLPADHGGIGPDLTADYSKLPREYLAESVIKAHKVVAVPGYTIKEGQAGMGKYNHFLTIQELIDLVAFLKNLPDTK
jgi:hypothetical protein